MRPWEWMLSRVYAAALIWDGLRKSVRPIAVDALRTLADRLQSSHTDPFGSPCVAGKCEFCGGKTKTHCDECEEIIMRPVEHEGAEEIGEQLMPGECAHEQCRFRGMAHYGTHVIDCGAEG